LSALEFPKDVLLHSPYKMAAMRYEGKMGMALAYQDTPDIVFVPSKPLTIYYTPRKGVFGRLYVLLLFAIQLVLRRKNALLFHGAAAVRDSLCVILTGLRGSGKSQLFLQMLHDDWHYLSDDKFILHDGQALMFQPLIGISDHHFSLQPWLTDQLHGKSKVKYCELSRNIRGATQRLSMHLMPKFIYDIALRYFKPVMQADVRTLFPQSELIYQKRIDRMVVLHCDQHLHCKRDKSLKSLEDIIAVQKLVFYSMGPFERLLYFCMEGEPIPQVSDVIKDNIEKIPLYKMGLPFGEDIEEGYEKLLRCLT